MQILGWVIVVGIVLFLVYVARKGNKEDVKSCCVQPSANVVPVKKTEFSIGSQVVTPAKPAKKVTKKVTVKKTK